MTPEEVQIILGRSLAYSILSEVFGDDDAFNFLPSWGLDPLEILMKRESSKEAVQLLMNQARFNYPDKFTEKHYIVIAMKLGLPIKILKDDGSTLDLTQHPHKYDDIEIATAIGVTSRQRVQQIKNEALDILKNMGEAI
jgi:hypothetical protein